MKYTLYDKSNGSIVGLKTSSYEEIPPLAEGLSAIDGHYYDHTTQYILNGEIANRPVIDYTISKTEIVANTVDLATISGVPSGATITWNGTKQITDGSDIEFVTDIIGEHKLPITLWPYQDAEVTIHAI